MCFISANVSDLSNLLLALEIIDMNQIRLSVKDNWIIVLEPFLVNKESTAESFDSRSVIVSPFQSAIHRVWFPLMLAECHMSVIKCILIVINNYFLAKFRNNISMEEFNVSRSRCFLHSYLCFVYFIYPISRNVCLLLIKFELIIDIRPMYVGL